MTEDLVCYCPTCTAPIHPVREDTNPGDLYLCWRCLTVSMLTAALTLRLVTAEDIHAQPIESQERLREVQRMQRGMPLDVYC